MSIDNLEKQKPRRGGPRAGAGRPRGVPNKVTRNAKENILQVYERLGGAEGLYEWCLQDPKNQGEFYKFYSRLLPIDAQLSGPNGGPIETSISLIVNGVEVTD